MPRGQSPERIRCLKSMQQALIVAGYGVARDVSVGDLFGVKNRKINMLATDPDGVEHFISLMGQTNSGTTVEKIPFGAMALIDLARRSNSASRFHLVLYGNEWNFKRFYLSGEMEHFLIDADLVNIVSLERFVELANQGRL